MYRKHSAPQTFPTNTSGSRIPVCRYGNVWRTLDVKSRDSPKKANPQSKLPITIQTFGDWMNMDNNTSRERPNTEKSAVETNWLGRENHVTVGRDGNILQWKEREAEASPIMPTTGSKIWLRVTASYHKSDKDTVSPETSTTSNSRASKLPYSNGKNGRVK